MHAVVLTGGSAFGLAAADGVMRWLEGHGVGIETGAGVVPIVPAAALFDLAVGRADVRPGPRDGYAACAAAHARPVEEGCVGAGTGASAGKLVGLERATKSGLGSAAVAVPGGPIVAALVAANPFGDVVDERSGAVLAGVRATGAAPGFAGPAPGFAGPAPGFAGPAPGRPAGAAPGARPLFAVSADLLRDGRVRALGGAARPEVGTSTVLAVVATDAKLTKPQAAKVARMAHDGIARAVSPAHTMLDGDTVFALATGAAGRAGDPSLIGALAAEAVAAAIVAAARTATALAGLPAGMPATAPEEQS